jgi:monoamine oxidase
MQIELGADNGVPLSQQSLLGMMTQIKGGGLERYWTDTEVYRCRHGSDALSNAFAQFLGKYRIHLRAPINQIVVQNNSIEVLDTAGNRWDGDHVVLTIPPSVWNKVTFQPKLPDDLAPQIEVNYIYLCRLRKEVWNPQALTHCRTESSAKPGTPPPSNLGRRFA